MCQVCLIYTVHGKSVEGSSSYHYIMPDGRELIAKDNVQALRKWLEDKGKEVKLVEVRTGRGREMSIEEMKRRVLGCGGCSEVWVDATRGDRLSSMLLLSLIDALLSGAKVIGVYSGWRDKERQDKYHVLVFGRLPSEVIRYGISLSPKFLEVLNYVEGQIEEIARKVQEKDTLMKVGETRKGLKLAKQLYTGLMLGIYTDVPDKDVRYLLEASKEFLANPLDREVVNAVIFFLDLIGDLGDCLSYLKFYYQYGHTGLYLLFASQMIDIMAEHTIRGKRIRPCGIETTPLISGLLHRLDESKINPINDKERLLELIKEVYGVSGYPSREELDLLGRLLRLREIIRNYRNTIAHGASKRLGEIAQDRSLQGIIDKLHGEILSLYDIYNGISGPHTEKTI